ncbi:endonuclease III [Succinivibrio faecicola]|uniref:Endonuclease III n=1 Tax=Succinivibrio faecicola TaxID=2820300 RepID=A0ABS7DDI7_9GAMM|nr:endonuclease III [Succinivibrio faecicola]MBW7569366.1 endonuclease III [Succinivibrio faecicola]
MNKLNKDSIEILFDRLSDKFKNPKSELDFNNNFELLCAVMLSAQTTDKAVNSVTPSLFKIAPNAKAMSLLDTQVIENCIKRLGLYKNKALNLKKMSNELVTRFNGLVPDNYDSLVSLPGVGSKTAKVVLNVGFKQNTLAVDTHIFRVCNRTGLCIGKTVKDVEKNVVLKVPKDHLYNAHHYLLLHGRYVCTARKPDCENCCIKDICKKNLD